MMVMTSAIVRGRGFSPVVQVTQQIKAEVRNSCLMRDASVSYLTTTSFFVNTSRPITIRVK